MEEKEDKTVLQIVLVMLKIVQFLISNFFFGLFIAVIYYFIWTYVNYDSKAAIGLVISHALVMKFIRPIVFDSENDDEGLRKDIKVEIDLVKKQLIEIDE
ncbi:hypothetical protein [Psychroflexus planctonicus]|nr:hypothetical protein [Psychroflexus planctonicus]